MRSQRWIVYVLLGRRNNQLIGLLNFLLIFTLSKERAMVEVTCSRITLQVDQFS